MDVELNIGLINIENVSLSQNYTGPVKQKNKLLRSNSQNPKNLQNSNSTNVLAIENVQIDSESNEKERRNHAKELINKLK